MEPYTNPSSRILESVDRDVWWSSDILRLRDRDRVNDVSLVLTILLRAIMATIFFLLLFPFISCLIGEWSRF